MLRALLVGIDTYPVGTASLHGCVADVDAVERLLTASGTTTSESVRVLRDEEATRQAVVDAFREHLERRGSRRRGSVLVLRPRLAATMTPTRARSTARTRPWSSSTAGRRVVRTTRRVWAPSSPESRTAASPSSWTAATPAAALRPRRGRRRAPGAAREDAPPVGLDRTHLASPSAPHPDSSSASTGSGWHAPRPPRASRCLPSRPDRQRAHCRRQPPWRVFLAALGTALSTAREGVTYDDLVRSAAATVRDWAEQQDPQARSDRRPRRAGTGALGSARRPPAAPPRDPRGCRLDAGRRADPPGPRPDDGRDHRPRLPPGTDPRDDLRSRSLASSRSARRQHRVARADPGRVAGTRRSSPPGRRPALVRTSDATDTEGLAGSGPRGRRAGAG